MQSSYGKILQRTSWDSTVNKMKTIIKSFAK